MTWAEFKEKIESEGVEDNMSIDFIDVNFGDKQHVGDNEFYIHIKNNSFNAY